MFENEMWWLRHTLNAMNLWYGFGAHAYISIESFNAITKNLMRSYLTILKCTAPCKSPTLIQPLRRSTCWKCQIHYNDHFCRPAKGNDLHQTIRPFEGFSISTMTDNRHEHDSFFLIWWRECFVLPTLPSAGIGVSKSIDTPAMQKHTRWVNGRRNVLNSARRTYLALTRSIQEH